MKELSSTFFECKVRTEKIADNGLSVVVSEQYAVDAMSFTEAESIICKEVTSTGEFEVDAIKKATYRSVILNDDIKEHWYKAKIAFITLNEKTGKEKKTKQTYLVNADTLNDADKLIDELMKGSVMDWQKVTIDETNILEVFVKE